MYKLAIIATHPIQYNTPWYQALSQHPAINLKVFFCHQVTPVEQAKAGFGVEFDWDTPILEGYDYVFLDNVSRNPSINHFFGLDTPKISNVIVSERFDTVIVSGWTNKAAWQAFRACWKTNTPVMVRGDSHLHTQRSLLKRWLKYPLYRWFLERMDACLAVGVWSRDYYLHYGVSPRKVFLVPHTVDEAQFSPLTSRSSHDQGFFRRYWNLPEEAIVFLFCGKLTEVKRPIDFVHALKIAQEVDPRIVGFIVGDGPLRKQCESAVKERGVRAYFAGFVNQVEMPNVYRASSCIVLPSTGETWGLVINEAMLSGLPAIVSDQVGCWPDLIIPSKTGDTFPVGQIEKLAEKLIVFARNANRLPLMGNDARLRIIQHFGLEQSVTGVIDAIETVAKR